MNSTYRIVVGVDGSPDSIRALRWAMGEARGRGGTVQAVMVYDWAGTEAALLAGLGPEGEHQHALDVLAKAVAEVQLEFRGMSVAAEVLQGNAGRRLAEAARDANLLVVGSHGHGRVHHAVLGSVSEACVRQATCPVVVIPLPRSESARTSGRLDTVGEN
jgi:nucleotide-binding universal stress UspA family protein